jgi:hypothetical protein
LITRSTSCCGFNILDSLGTINHHIIRCLVDNTAFSRACQTEKDFTKDKTRLIRKNQGR